MSKARDIVTLPDARERGLVRYFTGKPCRRGHVEWRQTSSATCMACDRENYAARSERRRPQMREYQERNRSAVRQASRAWKALNPDSTRAHRFNRQQRLIGRGKVTAEEVRALNARQGHRCASCRTSTRRAYHPDHIQPIARGGLNVIANIQILCPRCNYSKHAKDPIDWARGKGWLL